MPANSKHNQLSISPVSRALRTCGVCERRLPLREPGEGDVGIDWICIKCESVYHAVLIENSPAELLRRVCPTSFHFSEKELPPPPLALTEFARKLFELDTEKAQLGIFRRTFTAVLMAVLLNNQFQSTGAPFSIICRTLSTGEITIIADRRIETKLIAIQFPKCDGMSLQVAAKIMKQNPHDDFFEISGRFLTKIYV